MEARTEAGTDGLQYYVASPRKLPAREFDVLVAGGGTGGTVAALAAARAGARTALVEAKGYFGGTIVEGGCSLHSYFNLWQAFPGVEKRQLVRGIPDEIIHVLKAHGGTPGHVDQLSNVVYDSACTTIDTEIYKFVIMKMLRESGVQLFLNTTLTDVVRDGDRLRGAVVESHQGAEIFFAKNFIDATGFGDLSARASAPHIELNDHGVTNSMGVGGVNIERYYDFLSAHDAVHELARGDRDGKPDKVIRIVADFKKLGDHVASAFREVDCAATVSTTRDDYLMFVKISCRMQTNPLYRDALTETEYLLRERQIRSIELMRRYLPGCENAFIARTSPSLTIRRARCITCEYDMTNEEIINGTHYEDDILSYGFHDSAPRFQVKNGESYGLPYRAIQVKELRNLFAIGMLISTNHDAHMSTRNTVCCMAQGQAAGTAAALCALGGIGDVRDLPYRTLHDRLKADGVWFDHDPLPEK
ncbi:MAG: FAD-dependent oxidoreductase [Clostridiales bacterium]|jgi:hypothetical protein|nr:FAD-dependent oxidoreductase [Clostridiales bacterium]